MEATKRDKDTEIIFKGKEKKEEDTEGMTSI